MDGRIVEKRDVEMSATGEVCVIEKRVGAEDVAA